MNTIKYIFVQIEMIAMMLSVILGTGAAESNKWGWAILLIFGPFIYGKAVHFGNHIHFCEVYNRASRLRR